MIYKHFFLVTAISFGLAYALTPLFIKIAKKFRILDKPDSRKAHTSPTPTLGGIVIYFAFSVAVLAALRINSALYCELAVYTPGLLIGSLALVIFGVLHDTRDMPASVKLFGQIMVSLIIFLSGIRIEAITNPFGGSETILLYPLSLIVTVVWIVALINAINLIDGLDGLAAGIACISSVVLFLIALVKNDLGSMFICLALAGSCLGFLRYNFFPAKIFMGDAGSMFLGLILGVISIQGINKMAITVALMIPITVLAIPVYDTILSIIRRFISNKHIFKPDRQHIHYRLLDMGVTHKHVVMLLYFIGAYFGILAFLIILLPVKFAFIAILLLGMGVFMGIKAIGFIERRIKTIK
ncbi:MAG: MraY family glycosyltransferase [Candidatus Omnitrophota bacterium]